MMKIWAAAFLGCLVSTNCYSFSLLGPYDAWMTSENGFQKPGAIGGPKDLGEEYRWNVPVVTYGFDQSFRDFFGERGMQAVDQAVSILNRLPSASEMVLEEFGLDARVSNYPAQSLELVDVKSTVLAALLQFLGLAPALPNTFVIRDLTVQSEQTNALVIIRSFDPTTHMPSHFLNGMYLHWVLDTAVDGSWIDAVEYNIADPAFTVFGGVAGSHFQHGIFLNSITRDDAGGLSYIYSSNNLNVEDVLPGVQAANGKGEFVRIALRPGVEKVTFHPHPYNLDLRVHQGTILRFVDSFYQDGVARFQELERVIETPDILFAADTLGFEQDGTVKRVELTTAEEWINYSSLNSTTRTGGPGGISPGVIITLNKNPQVSQAGAFTWGSFGAHEGYYAHTGANEPLPQIEVLSGDGATVSVRLHGLAGREYYLESSTDLENWSLEQTLLNQDGTVDSSIEKGREYLFFRAIEGKRF